MNLNDVIKGENESLQNFLDRSYWQTVDYPKKPKIMVWKSKEDKFKSGAKCEIWTEDEFYTYCVNLDDSDFVPHIPANFQEVPQETKVCLHSELIKIEEEYIDDTPLNQKFECAWCGEIIHEIKEMPK